LPEFITHTIVPLPNFRAGRAATVTVAQRSSRHRIGCDDNYLDSQAMMHLQNGLARKRISFSPLVIGAGAVQYRFIKLTNAA
jgi:hypothetical protein